ncbi:MAG: metallopeptidase TldD-related protein, partial [Firmicutes bacterium]|nr:metallopeptidase TldD-related protein [Bacillota bacterium]
LVAALGTPGTARSGPTSVLLAPWVADALIGHYLAGNLAGENVAEGRSRFSLEQFRTREKVMREDVSVVVDTAIPLGPGSSPCTPEGIPSGSVRLIDSGRLSTPILNVRYAAKCGRTPTPVPQPGLAAGDSGLFLRACTAGTWKDLLRQTSEGLLVCSVLGLHTQDPTTGNFSLAAPETLVIQEGRCAGGVKAVISGNFLDALVDDGTCFGVDEDRPNPGIRLLCQATVNGPYDLRGGMLSARGES